MTLDIYLENQRLDIDDASSLAITYRFSYLTNPTTQTGDYSTTFTVKGTQHNNAIFGQIWRLDRVTLLGGELNTSVYFNASKRTDCVIYINHEVFKRGYIQLDAIKSAKGVISYDVTFYSEMVDVLRTLKESKLRDLPFPNDLRHTLNAATIKEHYYNGDYLRYIMANNGLYDDFESDKWLTIKDGKYVVESVLNEIQLDECAKREYRSYYQRPALRLKGIIDLIASEHGIQLDPAFFNDGNPYYADSVMALPQYQVTEQMAQETGTAQYSAYDEGMATFRTDTSTSFRNPTSPRQMPDAPFLYLKNQTSETVEPILSTGSPSPYIDFSKLYKFKGNISLEFEYRMIINTQTQVPPVMSAGENDYNLLYLRWNDGQYFYMPQPVLQIGESEVNFTMTEEYGNFGMKFLPLNGSRQQFVSAYMTPKKAYINSYLPEWEVNDPTTGTRWMQAKWNLDKSIASDAPQGRIIYRFVNPATGGDIATASEFLFKDNITACYGVNDQIMITQSYAVSEYILQIRPITKAPADVEKTNLNIYYPASDGFTGQDITISESYILRTGTMADKYDIIDDETTQGDFLINYAKLFGLLFYTDKDGTAHLVTRNTFFKDYKVEDWTQKIDHAKEIQQVPIPFNSKYLLMQYQDGETYYEQYYKTNKESEYGAQRIGTGYEFNTDETDLIPEVMFYNTIMSKERTRMLIGSTYIVENDQKVLPALFEKDGSERTPSDTKFNLLFFNGASEPTAGILPYYITDDNDNMEDKDIGGGKICWLNPETVPDVTGVPYKAETIYPQYSTVHKDGAFSWHLGYPLENYAGWMRSDFPESSTIYANFWRNYIAEIYDVDNRIMTAYVRLTAADIAQFSFANFVKIGDALWHVNKIEQFDPLGNGTTKVEFLRVSSLAAIENAYANGQTDMTYIAPPEPARYDVVLQLTHITSSTDDTNVEEGETFTAILDADTGYKIDSIVVTMGNTDITSQTIGGVKVWRPNANNSGGTITIAGVTDEVNIVASAAQVQPDNYRTIKVYSDIEGAIVESNGVRYTHLSMDTPAEVKVYWGDGVTDGITIDYSQAGNLPGTPVLIYGLPKPNNNTGNIAVWDTLIEPSRIDSLGEFYEYDDTDGDMEFAEGKTYVITALPAIGTARAIAVENIVRQTVSSYNGKTWTTLLNNVTADYERIDIPADSIALQFYDLSDRAWVQRDNGENGYYEFEGLGDNILVPAYYLRSTNSLYVGEM